jgi:hypothetical protein
MNCELLSLLKPYENILSKPQMLHFAAFATGLAACEIPSITRMSEIHTRSRSSMNRFLTESPWKIESAKSVYHKQIKPFLRKDSALLIDDTISKRPYAKEVEKANYHYDHTTNKDVLGYSIVTSIISSGEQILPYNIVPYYRDEDCQDRIFKTKNEIAVEIIESTASNTNITEVIFDTWYSNDIVIHACRKAKKNYITQLKANRNVTIHRHTNAVRAFVKDIQETDWEISIHNDSVFRFFSTSAFISKLGSIHLIFCEKFDNSGQKWGEPHFLISNLIETSSIIILHKYLNRVGIEGFHRDAKQNLGLEGYFLRNNRGIEKYLFLVMLAFGFLALQKMKLNLTLSIGELCEEQKVLVYKQTIKKIEKNPEFENDILNSLAKARV